MTVMIDIPLSYSKLINVCDFECENIITVDTYFTKRLG